MASEPDSVDRVVVALRRWRAFASTMQVNWAGRRRSWEDHIKGAGYGDEERLIQPQVFLPLPNSCWNTILARTLQLRRQGVEGTPDFTPADAVTHPFVFEAKTPRPV